MIKEGIMEVRTRKDWLRLMMEVSDKSRQSFNERVDAFERQFEADNELIQSRRNEGATPSRQDSEFP